jgi:hypothetical protein
MKPQNAYFLSWRKIELNYHICSANTTDYQLSDFPLKKKDILKFNYSPTFILKTQSNKKKYLSKKIK